MVNLKKLLFKFYKCNHTNIVHEVQAFYPDARCRLTTDGREFIIADEDDGYIGNFAKTPEKAWSNAYRLLRRRS